MPIDRFAAVLENLPQFIWAAGPDGQIAYTNRFSQEYSGLPREQLLGMGWIETVHPEDRERTLRLWNETVTAQRPGVWSVRVRRWDGEYGSFSCRSIPIPAPPDYPGALRWVGIAIDIDEKLALEATDARYRRIVETATEGIWMIDADNKTTFVNRRVAEMLGYSREEMLGRRMLEFVAPGHLAASTARAEKARRSLAERIHVEIQLVRKDSTPIWVDSVATVLVDEQGKLAGGLAILSDIDDRKRAEAKIREYSERQQALSRRIMEVQEVERRKLASQLNDEIGRVLSEVSGKLHAAMGGVGERARKKLEESIAIVDRAVAQARSMSLELRPAELDRAGLEAALIGYVEKQRERSSLPIELDVALERRLAPSLETACFRVVQEAVNNTIRHARAKSVSVHLNESDGRVLLEICDDGVGFDPEEARRRAARGISAGLVGMRERVLLVGGHLEIGSSPKCGTKIRVVIPLDRRTAS